MPWLIYAPEKTLVPTKYEPGWLVWMFWRREKSLARGGI
jgi:hypothetical protein